MGKVNWKKILEQAYDLLRDLRCECGSYEVELCNDLISTIKKEQEKEQQSKQSIQHTKESQS